MLASLRQIHPTKSLAALGLRGDPDIQRPRMIEPDTKDWTWVLERACPECGFDAPGLARERVPDAIRDNATLWEVVLGTDDAAVRPAPHLWSPLEYACHVRDVNRIFDERVRLM